MTIRLLATTTLALSLSLSLSGAAWALESGLGSDYVDTPGGDNLGVEDLGMDPFAGQDGLGRDDDQLGALDERGITPDVGLDEDPPDRSSDFGIENDDVGLDDSNELGLDPSPLSD